MFPISIPITEDTKSRKITKRLFPYNPPTLPHETRIAKCDASILVAKLKGIKPHCSKAKIRIRVTWRNETQYLVRITVSNGEMKIATLYDDSSFFTLPAQHGVTSDFTFDIWPLVRVLNKYKDIVHLYTSGSQLIVKQNRDRVALNFFGVKNG